MYPTRPVPARWPEVVVEATELVSTDAAVAALPASKCRFACVRARSSVRRYPPRSVRRLPNGDERTFVIRTTVRFPGAKPLVRLTGHSIIAASTYFIRNQSIDFEPARFNGHLLFVQNALTFDGTVLSQFVQLLVQSIVVRRVVMNILVETLQQGQCAWLIRENADGLREGRSRVGSCETDRRIRACRSSFEHAVRVRREADRETSSIPIRRATRRSIADRISVSTHRTCREGHANERSTIESSISMRADR